MNKTFRNYIILKLINALKGTHETYWKLYKLDDNQLLELYKILVDDADNE